MRRWWLALRAAVMRLGAGTRGQQWLPGRPRGGRSIRGSVEIAVRDVELAVGADADRDGKVTWGELRGAQRRLDEYLAQHLSLTCAGPALPAEP